MSRPTTWRTLEPTPVSPESLDSLCRAELPYLLVPGLLSPAESDAVVGALPDNAFVHYAASPAFRAFERFGIAQAGYGSKGRDQYFEDAEVARTGRDAVLARAGVDPLLRSMDRLRRDAGIDIAIAREPDGREYFAGIVRRMNAGIRLHADTCRRTDARWTIHASQAQLSLNVYVSAFQGGACVVHERLHEERDDATVAAGSYVYDRALVKGARAVRISPAQGDLVLINSRCYHEVEAAGSDRVSYAAFVGRLPDGRFVVWA